MSLWVKICGLCTAEAVSSAVSSGAQAVGFVFCETSPRNLDVAAACELQRLVPPEVERVAVFRHPSAELVVSVLESMRPDWIQTDIGDLETLTLPSRQRVLPVLRSAQHLPARLPPRVLFEGATSGAGERADWGEASRLARRTQVVLAGGLDPGNVSDAVRTVRPFGVDVSSGVEIRRGVKDGSRIQEFVLAARAAAAA